MKIYINGTEYAGLRDYRIEEQAGNKTSTSISVEVDGQPFPAAGDIVEIYDGEECIFYGMCGIPKSPKYQTLREKNIYTIVCGNANSILSNRVINEAYQGKSISYIVGDLFTNYVAEENITLGSISSIDVTMEVYTARDRNLQEALNELADLVGATWTITPDRKFYFYAADEFPEFPRTVSEDFLLGTDLQLTCRDYKTRTVQIISGATDRTSEQTESFIYDGTHTAFSTVFPIAVKPTITINGTAVSSDVLGVRGIDDNDQSMVFLFAYNSETVTYNALSYALTEGDTVSITYTGIFQIRVVNSNAAAISATAARTGTSGKREQVLIDKSITHQSDAVQLAQSLLDRFSEQTEELTFWLLASELERSGLTIDDTALLTSMLFVLPQIGIDGRYVVTARTIEPFAADLSGDKKITLRLTNRDYLRSSGETLTQLRRDINQLSIRENEIVVSPVSVEEIKALTETVTTEQLAVVPYYPTAATTGDLFVPCPLGEDVYAYE